MSKLVLHLPGNVRDHANLPAKKRRQYVAEFPQWVDAINAAGFPVAPSFQAADLTLTGVESKMFADTVDLMDAPYGHLLPSLYEKNGDWHRHLRWQMAWRTIGKGIGMFLPEFDIPRADSLPQHPKVIFAIPNGHTVAYSECGVHDVAPGGKLEGIDAIWFHNKIVVPMHGVSDVQKAFFFWQRFKTEENLAKVLGEIRKLAEDGEDRVRVIFLDLEAPLIGSHHGLVIWKELFQAIQTSGLSRHFISLAEACAIWERQAIRVEGAYDRFARHLGTKWTGLQPQLDYLFAVARLKAPESEADHVRMSYVTTSDVLAAMDRKIRGDITLDADQGPISISYDQAVIAVGKICFATSGASDSIRRLREAKLPDDQRWHAERAADAIEKELE